MSYQVLARKWRPRTFHELVGQAHVQRALVNALDQGRLHHAYLFTGTRGVGKTTLARILAKCLNCTAKGQGDEGVTSSPCGHCDSCRSIDEGRFVDLIEVDAASRTKVEDTRELLDNVQYAPTQGRYKVYLIDEVHMLSTSSFNALLKTLEEPPPHVKFLLATTDPQKLPPTVLSRCLQFTLKQMLPERIVEHLAKVLDAESIPFEESALWLLGKAADGSMRDAMSLADQAIAFGQGEVRHADVAAMLGTLDHRHVLALIEALAEVDAARLLSEVAVLGEQAPDFAAVLDDITGVLHRLAIAQMVPEALDNGHGDRETLLALAARFTAEDIQLYYQIGIQGRGDMDNAPDLRTALEMTLLRMLAFRPQGVPKPARTPLPLRGDDGSPSIASPSTPEAPSAAATPSSAAPEATDSEPDRPEPDAAPPPWEDPRETLTDVVYDSAPDPDPDAMPSTESPPSAPGGVTTLCHDDWLQRFESLGLGGLTRNLAANCVLESDDGDVLTLRLDATLSAMNAQVHLERIQQALVDAGISRRLYVEEGTLSDDMETPRQRNERLAAAQHAKAVEALNRDPQIQQLQETFGARLIEATVTSEEVEVHG